MTAPLNVAKFFINMADPEAGDSITHLKVQKLVYYAQGFHLAIFNEPLFEEDILHWLHGPVVESIFHSFKEYGSNPIERDNEFHAPDHFNKETLELLAEVYEVYGQYSAWKLRNMTHAEAPWLSTEDNEVISKESLKAYFDSQIN